jgi:hypothetical protein
MAHVGPARVLHALHALALRVGNRLKVSCVLGLGVLFVASEGVPSVPKGPRGSPCAWPS